MARESKNRTFPVVKTVYLSHETDDVLTTMAKLVDVPWTTFVRSILDQFVNQQVEEAENAVLRNINESVIDQEEER